MDKLYFNAFSASFVSLFLSNILIIVSIIAVNINVTAYAAILNFILPSTIPAPAIVDDITDGNLANVDIKINLNGFIGSKPPIYTNKSLGVPGIKNSIIKIISTFFGFFNILLFSNLSIFSFLNAPYTNFFPYFFTVKNKIVVVINTEAVINIVPPILPITHSCKYF